MVEARSKPVRRAVAGAVALATGALALSALALAGPASGVTPGAAMGAGARLAGTRFVPQLPSRPISPASSVWRTVVSKAPVADDSASLVDSLDQQVAEKYDGTAAFNYDKYTVAFYQVGAKTPRVNVYWDNCQGQSSVPWQLYNPAAGAHFVSVPIPDGAVPSVGTDGELSLYSAATDQMWDFWKAHEYDGKWFACWGGRIDDWSTNPGYFPLYTGASASGLAVEGGTIGLAEAKKGVINHALSLAVTNTSSSWSYPAQRSDGRAAHGTGGAIPLGTRFRLDRSVDVDSLGLSPMATMVAKAAQRYGFIVSDTSNGVAVTAERGTPRTDGTSDWDAQLGGVPGYQVMAGFPWDKLQALPQDYGKPAS